MTKVDTILMLIRTIEYTKRELTLIDHREQLSFNEKEEKRLQLQKALVGSLMTYANLTYEFFEEERNTA